MRHFLFFLVAIIFLAQPVLAQPSKPPSELGSLSDPEARDEKAMALPTINATEVLDKDFPGLPQTLRWEIALAVRAVSVSDTPRTRSDLLTAASKGIEILCLGELQRSLSSDTSSLEPDCVKLLDIVRGIDPDSPLVLCTRSGVDSEECRKSYLTQSTTSEIPVILLRETGEKKGDSFDQYSFQNDLAVKLDAEKADRGMREIRQQIDKIRPKGKVPLTPEQIRERDILIGKLLQSGCSLYRLVSFPKAMVVTAMSTPTPVSGMRKKGGSLEDLLSAGPFKGAADPNANRGVQNHFRLVSRQCLSAIEQSAKYNPSHPAVPCRRDGVTSPSCIQARRIFNKTLPKGAGAANNNNEGIEKF